MDASDTYLPNNNTYRNKNYLGSLQNFLLNQQTCQLASKVIQKCSSATISTSVWNSIYMGDCMHQLWVHVMANGLFELNQCCSFAFKHHWIKKENSQKQHGPIFRAEAYCTFSNCPLTAKLTIRNENLQTDNVIVQVRFTGCIQHSTEETQAQKISSSTRSHFLQHLIHMLHHQRSITKHC